MSGSSLSSRPRWIFEHPFLLLASGSGGPGPASFVFTSGGGQGVLGGQLTVLGHNIEPDDYDIYEQQQQAFLECRFGAGNVAPARNIYVSLFPVAALTGTDAARTATAGAEVDGSRTASVPTPAANTISYVRGPQFNLPPAGLYVASITVDGAMAATSYLAGGIRLGVVSV